MISFVKPVARTLVCLTIVAVVADSARPTAFYFSETPICARSRCTARLNPAFESQALQPGLWRFVRPFLSAFASHIDRIAGHAIDNRSTSALPAIAGAAILHAIGFMTDAAGQPVMVLEQGANLSVYTLHRRENNAMGLQLASTLPMEHLMIGLTAGPNGRIAVADASSHITIIDLADPTAPRRPVQFRWPDNAESKKIDTRAEFPLQFSPDGLFLYTPGWDGSTLLMRWILPKFPFSPKSIPVQRDPSQLGKSPVELLTWISAVVILGIVAFLELPTPLNRVASMIIGAVGIVAIYASRQGVTFKNTLEDTIAGRIKDTIEADLDLLTKQEDNPSRQKLLLEVMGKDRSVRRNPQFQELIADLAAHAPDETVRDIAQALLDRMDSPRATASPWRAILGALMNLFGRRLDNSGRAPAKSPLEEKSA